MPRLSDVLRERGLTTGDAKRALESGKVLLRGVPTADGGRDVDSKQVDLRLEAPKLRPGRDIVILYKDDWLAVVWKPAGMLSVAAGRPGGGVHLLGAARRLLGEALPVHRLDEHTSGLMMVARTDAAQQALKDLLEDHRIERRYLALVHGHFPRSEQVVKTMLVRDRGDGLRGSVRPPRGWQGLRKRLPPGFVPDASGARESTTRFKLVEHVGPTASLVEARLETGRTHQVRIHLSELGYPVLGEALYAGRPVARLAPRVALHAAYLSFKHPGTGKTLSVEAPLADDLELLRRGLLVQASLRR